MGCTLRRHGVQHESGISELFLFMLCICSFYIILLADKYVHYIYLGIQITLLWSLLYLSTLVQQTDPVIVVFVLAT
jgi:hypothetical protein